MVNFDGMYKPLKVDDLREKVERQMSGMVIFDKLLESVVYLINQIRCIDDNVILLGRRGTGKRFMLQLAAKLTGITFATNFSEAVLTAIKHQKIIYVQQIEAGCGTCY